ncbi:ABC transporter permease [Roseibacillus persicicus]|uniref:ABC transporter substrate-binding protein n=1 Tax=Roseibacillus persicicus TaxID=454148 RepID=A0A918TB89_9BACT|nr:ABC transporter permease [Roseibacillus persicicus]GHC40995.1 ABC transporter substrate-binding protein [Roseibacillus persicicus]
MLSSHFLNTVQLAVKSLLMHKLRSGLTMLGIIFGVCSVIAMLAIGEGASYEAQERIKRLGSENIIINSVKPPEDNKQTSQQRNWSVEYGLTYKDVTRIQDTIPSIERVVPLRIIRENIRFDRNQESGQVIGTLPSYREVQSIDLVAGRFLSPTDELNKRTVCVITHNLARQLFPYQDPLESTVRVDDTYYQVIGIVNETGTAEQRPQGQESEGQAIDNNIYIPLSAARTRFGETLITRTSGSFNSERVELHRLIIKMKDSPSVIVGEAQIQHLMNHFHEKNDFELIVPLQLLREAEATKKMFNIVLGSIAAISLLVGGIGIMNIMLATVTERTREIGIRRALGATRKDIITQFLIETIVLSVGGGIIGVILGIIVPIGVEFFTEMQTIITLWSVLLAFGISGLTGVIFGLYPASQAAKLDPIDALRQE